MNEDERERELAEQLAQFHDRQARAREEGAAEEDAGAVDAALGPELEEMAEIDVALELDAGLPERLSGHRLLAEIGEGGMGRVFLAEDEALGRKVAIKTLHPRYGADAGLRARFMREARTMAHLTHPNIVRIYNLGPPDEPPHFVMEYLKGAPLTQAAAKLTFHQKAELMRKVVLAAAFLHEHDVIHRDLKPANVLVGPDLEPKLLDLGLALDAGARERRLSRAGEIVGTPEYLSPEQTEGGEAPDARSDIFSLGAMLYELLTGVPAFEGRSIEELVRQIRESDPVLPRRRDPHIPKDLQNICLKALEKKPADRYGSAREMARDLERFLAGEAVVAAPQTYSRLIGGRVQEHVRELESWWREQIISDSEYDGLRKRYERLTEHEDAWIMEARRLTVPQVTLYLGAWVLAVGAALPAFFEYARLSGPAAVLTACAAAAPTAWIGIRLWKRGHFRVAVAFLLAFCLLLPVAVLVGLTESHIASGFTQGQERMELFVRMGAPKQTTNAQVWWALLAALPASLWLRRFTRAPVFSLVAAAACALFGLVTLLRMGALDWLANDPGRFYFHLIPWAALFLAAGFVLERWHKFDDSRYVYPFGVIFTWMALSGVAGFHEPYAKWLGRVAPWTRAQIEYLFILNAGVYFLLDRACELLRTPQMRNVGKAFRFVIPGHVLTSLFLLGLSASQRWEQTPANAGFKLEARLLEWLLPAAAFVFVFGSIPRQMKNFFATGLLFLALGVVRLQQDYFRDRALWPMVLIGAGLSLMLAAAHYAPLRMRVRRIFRR
jgi:hypothetical protein